ncbi:MAG TPA: molybdate ABC transporter substrate-binding protein [Gemmatimonadaceae bacterium]|nr:molybdate ABC transporter substrate-binding protein [Gemmatimonadaceae bacterium]
MCAAISLSDALEAIAKEYAAAGGGPVRFNFAGSNTLARQLANGAPADLFLSADEAQMDVAARAGAVDPASRVNLLGNRLAIVARPGTPSIDAAADLARPGIGRIAIGDPLAVPAGVYARRYLESAGLWPSLADRIVPVGNVRAALAAVMNGSADAAIVYESDTVTAGTLKSIVIAGSGAPRIVYPAALVTRAANRAEAERFLAFLRGPQAAAVFARYKFAPLGPH